MQTFLLLVNLFTAFVVIQSKLYIDQPKELSDKFKNGIKNSMANFGEYSYGYTQHGTFILGRDKDKSDSYFGCDQIILQNQNLKKNQDKKIFLVLDRGECQFGVKAVNAQKMNVNFLIIIDNQEGDIVEKHVLIDKQNKQILIPTIMISYEDGQQIKDMLLKNQNIEGKFHLDHPTRKNVVDVQLWVDPLQQRTYNFLKNYWEISQEIGIDKLQFKPRFYTRYYPSFRESDYNELQDTRGECLGSGRYCAKDPEGPLKGQDLVDLMVRSVCLFDIYGQEIWIQHQILFYMICVKDNLENLDKQTMIECFENVLNSSQINLFKNGESLNYLTTFQIYKQCYDDSWESTNQENQIFYDNVILREQKIISQENDIQNEITLLINGQLFYGDMQIKDAIEEIICESFLIHSEPVECINFDKKWREKIQEDDENNTNNLNTEQILQINIYRYLQYFLILIGFLVLGLIFSLIISKSIRKRIEKILKINNKYENESGIQMKQRDYDQINTNNDSL